MNKLEVFKIFELFTNQKLLLLGYNYKIPVSFLIEQIEGFNSNPNYKNYISMDLYLDYQNIINLQHITDIIVNNYLMFLDSAKKFICTDPNNEYRLIHYENYNNITYDWQLITDGDIVYSVLGTYPRNHVKAESFCIPGSSSQFEPNCWPIRNVRINNAKYSILRGRINNEVKDAKIYSLEEDLNYLEKILEFEKNENEYRKITNCSPYVYKLTL